MKSNVPKFNLKDGKKSGNVFGLDLNIWMVVCAVAAFFYLSSANSNNIGGKSISHGFTDWLMFPRVSANDLKR